MNFLQHAAYVAGFYGFRPMRVAQAPVEIEGVHTPPVFGFRASASPAHLPEHLSARESAEFVLSIVGHSESSGEVTLIKTISAICSEWNGRHPALRINALGDYDSRQRFTRELGAFVRKHLDDLEPATREASARDPFAFFRSPVDQELLRNAPRAVTFLSEKSREHFRTLLEQLEELSLPYDIDDTLLGDGAEAHVAFAMDVEDGLAAGKAGVIHGALGGRYEEPARAPGVARRVAGKKDVSALEGKIFFRKKSLDRSDFAAASTPPAKQKPSTVYFVRLGLRAELRSLAVVDVLRHAGVPTLLSFDSRSLSMQLDAARTAGVSHILIMGEREALDRTVILRKAHNSMQSIIPLGDLPRALRSLRV